jgi:hypothetical protein
MIGEQSAFLDDADPSGRLKAGLRTLQQLSSTVSKTLRASAGMSIGDLGRYRKASLDYQAVAAIAAERLGIAVCLIGRIFVKADDADKLILLLEFGEPTRIREISQTVLAKPDRLGRLRGGKFSRRNERREAIIAGSLLSPVLASLADEKITTAKASQAVAAAAANLGRAGDIANALWILDRVTAAAGYTYVAEDTTVALLIHQMAEKIRDRIGEIAATVSRSPVRETSEATGSGLTFCV